MIIIIYLSEINRWASWMVKHLIREVQRNGTSNNDVQSHHTETLSWGEIM